MAGEQHGPSLTTERVSAFVRAGGEAPTTRTVSDWAKKGFVRPSRATPQGRRRPVLWTVEDAVCARALYALRCAACDIHVTSAWVEATVRPLLSYAQPPYLSVSVLGRRPTLQADSGSLPEPDSLVNLPLGEWVREAESLLEPQMERYEQGSLLDLLVSPEPHGT